MIRIKAGITEIIMHCNRNEKSNREEVDGKGSSLTNIFACFMFSSSLTVSKFRVTV